VPPRRPRFVKRAVIGLIALLLVSRSCERLRGRIPATNAGNSVGDWSEVTSPRVQS
jgi:hypothetical protein